MAPPCPFCDCERHEVYCSASSGTILQCMACGGRFTEDRRAEILLEDSIPAPSSVAGEYLESYADARETELEIARNVVKFIVDAVGLPSKVLEIGCGHAEIEQALAELVPNAVYTGVEISRDLFESLEPIRKRRIVHAPTLERALALTEANDYDLVVMHHVLEHLPAPAHTLQLVRRKLRPGGRLFLEVPNEQWKRPLITLRRLLKRGGDDWFPGHINFFTLQPLVGLVRSQGFTVVVTKVVAAADLPALVVKMLGGPRAYRNNYVGRAALGVLQATRVEGLIGYGIALRCIAQT